MVSLSAILAERYSQMMLMLYEYRLVDKHICIYAIQVTFMIKEDGMSVASYVNW